MRTTTSPTYKPKRKRHIARYSLLVLLVGFGILSFVRRNAWFGNTPEIAYQTPDSIDRITVTPGESFVKDRTISWRCGEELQEAWLEYQSSNESDSLPSALSKGNKVVAQGQLIHSRTGKGCFYQVHLNDLQEGQSYFYQIHTGSSSSAVYHLSIPYSQERSEFVYLGDVQDPIGVASDTLLTQLSERFRGADFLATAGDQIDGPANQYWDIWYQALGGWSPELSIVASTGNHEYLKRGFLRELDPRWVPQYGFPTNGPQGFEGRSYYIDFPLMRYIVMDSNGIVLPWDIMKHRSWLRRVLNESKQPWQVVMFHHAIYSVRDGRSNPIMRYGFRGILEEEGADLILQGHDHAYSRINSRSETNERIAPVYIISSSSPKVYRNGFDEIHDRLGSGLQLYQHIVVKRDSLHYRSYEYSGALYDDIALVQRPNQRPLVKDYAGAIPEQFRFDAFGQDKKGQKKATKYRQAVEEYLKKRQSLSKP